MVDLTQPRYPIYIPSKSRALIAKTPHVLDNLKVPWRMVVEEQQYAEYAAVFDPGKLIVLDPQYQRDYETLDDDGDSFSKGSGPARNFIWDHAVAEGHDWHWIMDDNIHEFYRFHENRQLPFGDGMGFNAMESFVLRYSNVAMAGPEYVMFMPSRRSQKQPFRINTRVFSCNLIRCDLTQRWRGRFNEDLILSIDLLKAGWSTVLFHAFLQHKVATQSMPGGNTEAFYAQRGTLIKSQMAVRAHPDVVRLAHRFGRDHHVADLKRFQDRGLVRDPDVEVPAVNPYREKTIKRRITSAKLRQQRMKEHDHERP